MNIRRILSLVLIMSKQPTNSRLIRKYSAAFPQHLQKRKYQSEIQLGSGRDVHIPLTISPSREPASIVAASELVTVGIPHIQVERDPIAVSICATAEQVGAWYTENNVNKENVIGFDVEWKPAQANGQSRSKIALLQLATLSHVALIQVHKIDSFPISLRELLRSKSVLKVGVNILNDFQLLKHDYGLEYQGAVDLRKLLYTSTVSRFLLISYLIIMLDCNDTFILSH